MIPSFLLIPFDSFEIIIHMQFKEKQWCPGAGPILTPKL
jgi:hypothetical protein